MPLKDNSSIDIPLDGVGAEPSAVRRSRINIALDSSDVDPEHISNVEMELVNRHHAEVKASYQRAQKGE